MGFSDDVIYLTFLISSVPLGQFIIGITSYRQKQLTCSLIGFLIALSVCGISIVHSLFTTIVNALIIKLFPRKCHVISFFWCFGYIVFFRLSHYFGLPPIPPHCNAVQLVLTLKLVGLANEVRDTLLNKESLKKSGGSDRKLQLQNEYQNICPSVLDMFHYVYTYIGLLTGPYYKYRTYEDMLRNDNAGNIEIWGPVIYRIKWVPVYAACFIIGGLFFNLEFARMDEFYEEPFWFRLVFMTPMFFLFRMRFYVAWTIAECACITATLGAYPVSSKPKIGAGPTDFDGYKKTEIQAKEGINYDFETMRTIDIWGCELAPTVREGVRSWNTTVQYWLANIIYRRLPIKSAPIKVAITMSVSAFWHGIYAGYYLSFLLIPVAMMGEDAMSAAFRNNKSPRQQIIYDWLAWFFKMRLLDYMCMSFLLLTLHDTLRFWSSIYYIGHITGVLFIVIGYCFKPKQQLSKPKSYNKLQ